MFRHWAAHRVSCFSPHKNKFCETCATIFSTAPPVFKYTKQRNKKIKNIVYVAAYAPPFFLFTYKDVLQNPRSVAYHLLIPDRS